MGGHQDLLREPECSGLVYKLQDLLTNAWAALLLFFHSVFRVRPWGLGSHTEDVTLKKGDRRKSTLCAEPAGPT